eukprot:233191_1
MYVPSINVHTIALHNPNSFQRGSARHRLLLHGPMEKPMRFTLGFNQPNPWRRSGGNHVVVMRARNCDLLGKKPNRNARVITFSHKRIKKVQHLNLHRRRFYSDELRRIVNMRVSTKGIKTINKYGIDKAAKKFDVNLRQF